MKKPIADYRYFRAMRVGPEQANPSYELINRQSGAWLGRLSWYRPWRQYVFTSDSSVVWSKDCLADIQHLFGKIRSLKDGKAKADTPAQDA